jgi:hypothetical protein
MTIKVVPFKAAMLPEAMELLDGSYQNERKASPRLPPVLLCDKNKVLPYIGKCISNGCVAACREGRMVGFMGVSSFFLFKGLQAAKIGELCHSSVEGETYRTYQLLYQAVGEELKRKNAQLHIVAHFAADMALREFLFQFGFGAFVVEELRDLSPIGDSGGADIREEKDFSVIEELDAEHGRYYSASPIFLKKITSPEAVRARIVERQNAKETLLVYYEGKKPAGYFIVGPCLGNKEGLLLRDSNTAQLKSVYMSPSARGRGAGKALLQRSI